MAAEPSLMGKEGGGKVVGDEGMEEGKEGGKGESKGERQRSHLHMFLYGESFSLPDLTFSKARSSSSGSAKETMKCSSVGPRRV